MSGGMRNDSGQSVGVRCWQWQPAPKLREGHYCMQVITKLVRRVLYRRNENPRLGGAERVKESVRLAVAICVQVKKVALSG